MHAFKSPRFLCALLAFAPLSLRAQDHVDPAAEKAATTPNPAQKKGPGRGKGGGGAAGNGAAAPAAAAQGGRGPSAAELATDLEMIIADPGELAKGRKIFESQCVQCHGPKGEGDRGPTLAQPELPRAGDNVTLMQIVARGLPGTEMPGGRLKPGDAPYLAAYVRSLGRMPIEKVPGDSAKGAELFKTKGACLTCHTLEGQGVAAIGPDLTGIGARRSPAFLRRSLVDPGADVPLSYNPTRTEISMPLNFAFVRAKTKDGKAISGVRINENTFSVQLRDLTGAIWSFYKSELAEFSVSKNESPMPVYAGIFTPTELDDVIAYLVSLRGKKQLATGG
ncbi:MAG: c-type cytochrome [Opitutus sp.]|nr:c-type cytochrome [Opitutus sp.]